MLFYTVLLNQMTLPVPQCTSVLKLCKEIKIFIFSNPTGKNERNIYLTAVRGSRHNIMVEAVLTKAKVKKKFQCLPYSSSATE